MRDEGVAGRAEPRQQRADDTGGEDRAETCARARGTSAPGRRGSGRLRAASLGVRGGEGNGGPARPPARSPRRAPLHMKKRPISRGLIPTAMNLTAPKVKFAGLAQTLGQR